MKTSRIIILAAALPIAAFAQTSPNDVTFVFTADVHVSFDGTNDMEGFQQTQTNPLFVIDETANDPFLKTQHDGCILPEPGTSPLQYYLPATKDLCDQIQHVRKMNALPNNSWSGGSFTQNGHLRTLASAGNLIDAPLGVLIGGDLTDCAGGNSGATSCPGYSGSNSAQLVAFSQMYDRDTSGIYSFNDMSFLRGLTTPDQDVPLKYPIYPGFGNHDIDNPGNANVVSNYISQWNPSAANPDRHVLNQDPNTLAYSFDWGNVHVVNVGVYPGSGNDYTGNNNYNCSTASQTWLENDLKNYAQDRPVIIASHFGFDSLSLSTDWWEASTRVACLQGLADILRNYDVIGFYHGHIHSQKGVYQFPNASSSAALSQFFVLPPVVPYDIIEPGAGYDQDFAVTHVTDSHMDVLITQDVTDYVAGSPIVFGQAFTKILAPAPRAISSTSDVQNQSRVVYVSSGGVQYVLSTGPIESLPQGYVLRKVVGSGRPEIIDSGPLLSAPAALASYSIGGVGHILILFEGGVSDYQVVNGKLIQNWSSPLYGAGSMMPFSQGENNYLLIDATALTQQFELYQITSTGINLTASLTPTYNGMFYNVSPATGTQMALFPPLPGSPTTDLQGCPRQGLSRYVPATGVMEYYSMGMCDFDITWKGNETWSPNASVTMAQVASNVEFFVTSSTCLTDANASCNPDSPFFIRTLLDDEAGTDVSWRGMPSALTTNVVATFVMDTVGNSPTLGAYGSNGEFITFALDPPTD